MVEKLAEVSIRILAFLLDRIASKRVLKNAQAIANIYSILKKTVLYNSEVSRMIVWLAEDSGSNIKPGVQLYISSLYEDYEKPVRSSKKYQRVMTDGDYVNILVNAMSGGSFLVETENLRERTVMHLINSSEEGPIVCTKLHHLYSKGNAIYYITVDLNCDPEQADSNARLHLDIDLAVQDIRKLMKIAF